MNSTSFLRTTPHIYSVGVSLCFHTTASIFTYSLYSYEQSTIYAKSSQSILEAPTPETAEARSKAQSHESQRPRDHLGVLQIFTT